MHKIDAKMHDDTDFCNKKTKAAQTFSDLYC